MHTWGYWNDGVKEPFKIMDAATYSLSGNLIGSRIYFYPQNVIDEFILPFKFGVGLSYHFMKSHYVGGIDYAGNHRDDSYARFVTFDLSVGADINIIEALSFGLEGDLYFPSKPVNDFYDITSLSSIKLGLTYNF